MSGIADDRPFKVLVPVITATQGPSGETLANIATHRLPSAAKSSREDRVIKAPHPFVVLPGWGGSGPDHWQSLWQSELGAVRVPLRDWNSPDLDTWVKALDAAVVTLARRDPRPPVLIAHSLGCIVVAHWARRRRRVRAALLVAPADVESETATAFRSFGPVPRDRLPFPSTVIASDDDPFVSAARAEAFAKRWGSRLQLVSGGGHLNAESGLGDWRTGRKVLKKLLATP